jgi:hypothetical protein
VARHGFKTTGIARSGFEYQDLIGIEVLLKFYRDPNLYHWVELESEDKTAGKLDDVVGATDGLRRIVAKEAHCLFCGIAAEAHLEAPRGAPPLGLRHCVANTIMALSLGVMPKRPMKHFNYFLIS